MSEDGPRFEFPDPPPPLMPVEAVKCFDMRGARVLVGESGVGWRGDLRADQPLMRSGALMVPVLPESEYYRCEDEGCEAMAALYPAERVWVEKPDPESAGSTAPQHLFERLADMEQPPRRNPVPASDVHSLIGRRMWHWKAGAFAYDLRCVSEAFENADGDIAIRLCPERDWYRWGRTGKPPASEEALIHLAWVES